MISESLAAAEASNAAEEEAQDKGQPQPESPPAAAAVTQPSGAGRRVSSGRQRRPARAAAVNATALRSTDITPTVGSSARQVSGPKAADGLSAEEARGHAPIKERNSLKMMLQLQATVA